MNTDQFATFQKSSVDAALKYSRISVDTAERLMKLQLEASKNAMSDVARNVKSMVDVKEPQQLWSLRAPLAEEGVEKAMSYARALYEVSSTARSQISELVEESWKDIRSGVATRIDLLAQSAPSGAEVAIAAIKTTVATTTAAIDALSSAVKQAAQFTDSGVKIADGATSAKTKAAKT
jgi:phasin family protein